MKNPIARSMTVVSLAVLLLAGQSYGQYVQRIIKVNAPFEFTVNNRSFPAGEYSIVCLAPNRLDLRDARNWAIASLITHSAESRQPRAATKLEFSTADGSYALTRIWVANDRFGYELPTPRANAIVARGSTLGSVHTSGAGNK
ncbi:MAG: hypothetical protein WB510_08250 [Candidatus Sulfotelmatobacter sp.]